MKRRATSTAGAWAWYAIRTLLCLPIAWLAVNGWQWAVANGLKDWGCFPGFLPMMIGMVMGVLLGGMIALPVAYVVGYREENTDGLR